MPHKMTKDVKRANKYLLIKRKIYISGKYKNGKVIIKKSPMIHFVEVDNGKSATLGDGKMKNSYS